jgi:3-hydroxyisobutyrate dehydrogenase
MARFASGGGRASADASQVAAASDLLLIVLRDERQIDDLFDAVGHDLCRGSVVWLASTVAPSYATALGERLSLAGQHFLDGPVSGGVARARVGELTLILAGDDIACDAVSTLAPSLARQVFRVGMTPGAASAIKAINQLLTACHIAVTAEALGFGLRAGIDPHLLQEVVNASAGASRMFEDRAPRMLDGDETPYATLGIFLKDLGIARGAARQFGAATPIADAAENIFRQAAQQFGESIGDPAIFRLYRPDGWADATP